MSDQEYSESGNPIYRYNNPTSKDFIPAIGDGESIETISTHIAKHVGPPDIVFHEIVSDIVHIDIHWVKPSDKFPFHTLVTSGMSDRPMTVPEGLDELKYAELCILLPADWAIGQEEFKDENNYWPVRWLKKLARFPHEYETWLGYGHTIPNGENAEPFAANTKFGCLMLFPNLSIESSFYELKISDEKTINFYCLYPLYKEEMELKLKKGTDGLIDQFKKFGVTDIVDIRRANTCKRKGLFGLW